MLPQNDVLETYIKDLEKQLTEARHQRDEQAARCRAAAQALIEDVGADGPMSLEQVIERTRARLAELEAKVARRHGEPADSEFSPLMDELARY